MNPEALLSRLSAIVTEPGCRLDRLQKVACTLRESAGYRWVGLYDGDLIKVEVRTVVWAGPAAPEYPTFPVTKGLTGGAIAQKKTINVGDVASDPRYLTALATTRSEIIVPVLGDQGEVIGTIDVESERPNAFDQNTEQLLKDCAVVLRPLFEPASDKISRLRFATARLGIKSAHQSSH
jgi:L-methionine (R)-S-oxide reductase